MLYDRLDLLGPATRADVLNDLRVRTRLPITRFEVGKVDLLRDTADIVVYYPASNGQAAVAAAEVPHEHAAR